MFLKIEEQNSLFYLNVIHLPKSVEVAHKYGPLYFLLLRRRSLAFVSLIDNVEELCKPLIDDQPGFPNRGEDVVTGCSNNNNVTLTRVSEDDDTWFTNVKPLVSLVLASE